MVFFSYLQQNLLIFLKKQNLKNRKSKMATVWDYYISYHYDGNSGYLSNDCYYAIYFVGHALIACQRAGANSFKS